MLKDYSFVGIEEFKGKPVVITSKKSWFGFKSKTVKFLCSENYVSTYWKWLKLPEMILVPDNMSFQLDEWYNNNKLT